MIQSPIPSTNLEAIYQHPADLELGVFTGELPLSLTILAQRWMTIGEWRFGFHIIGESHFVRIERHGEVVLQEVLACIHLPPSVCLHHHRCSDLAMHTYQHGCYAVALDFDSAPGKPLPDNTPALLQLQFPAIYGQIPLTQIHLEANDTGLEWWTTHLYPQPHHLTTVCTYSRWNFQVDSSA